MKNKLRIGLLIAKNFDHVPHDFLDYYKERGYEKEIEYELGYSVDQELIEEVVQELAGFSVGEIIDIITTNYFEDKFNYPLPDFLYEKDGDIFSAVDYGKRVTEEYYEFVNKL